MFSNDEYSHIVRNCLTDSPLECDDLDKVDRGVSLLRSVRARFLVESARGRAIGRTEADNKLKVIRHHIATVVAALDADTPEPPSDAPDTIKQTDLVKSELFLKLGAVHNMWRVQNEQFDQDFYGLIDEITGALKKAERFFSYLEQIQAEFDGMNEEERNASFFPRPTDEAKLQRFRLAYRGAYPYLQKYSPKTPVHLTLPLIFELHELLNSKPFGIAPNYKHNKGSHDDRLFVSRWNSPGLRISYRVIRELGMLNSFITPKTGFGPCNGSHLKSNASLSCTDTSCLPCRHAEAICLDVIGNYWNNSRGLRN